MSFNDSKQIQNNLIGLKVRPSSDLNELLKNEELGHKEKESTRGKCHHCNGEDQPLRHCKQCDINFCLPCINDINETKDQASASKSHPKIEDTANWVCFVCLKECPCKDCGGGKKEKISTASEKKCLLCKTNILLIKIDDKLSKLKITEEKRKELIEKQNAISTILQANPKEEKLICKVCLSTNNIVNNFLKGEITTETTEKNHPNSNEKREEAYPFNQQQYTINKQNMNVIENHLQSNTGTVNNMKEGNMCNQMFGSQLNPMINNQNANYPNGLNTNSQFLNNSLIDSYISSIQPQSQLQLQQHLQNQHQPQSQAQSQPQQQSQSQSQSQSQQPMQLSMNIFQQYQNVGFNQLLPPVMQNINQQQNTSNSLNKSFANITLLLHNFNDQSIQTNQNAISNINQLSLILLKINDNKSQNTPDDENKAEKENSTMKTIWSIIQNIKTQINLTYNSTQMQKRLIAGVMKNLEQSMQQEVNQNQSIMNEIPPNSMLGNNQINSLLNFHSPMQISDGQGLNSSLEGLMGKVPFNQGLFNQINSNIPNSNEKNSQKPGMSPSFGSNEVPSQLKETNKMSYMGVPGQQGMQGLNQLAGLQTNMQNLNQNMVANMQLKQPSQMMGNSINSPQNMNALQGQNSSNIRNSLPSIGSLFQSNNPMNLNSQMNSLPANFQSMMLPNNSSLPGLNQIQQGIPLMVPGLTQMSQGLSQNNAQISQEQLQIKQGMNKGLPQGLGQGINQGLPQGLGQGINQGLPQGLGQGINQGLPQGLGQNLQQMSSGSNQGFPQMHQGMMNQGFPQMPQGMNQGYLQMPQGMNQCLSQQGIEQKMFYYMNQPMLDNSAGIIQNPQSHPNDPSYSLLSNNNIKFSQEDPSQKNKEK